MDKPQEKRTQFWLGMLISAICILIIFWLVEPAEIVASLRQANYWYLAACAALGVHVDNAMAAPPRRPERLVLIDGQAVGQALVFGGSMDDPTVGER